jgi:hypothetical protein
MTVYFLLDNNQVDRGLTGEPVELAALRKTCRRAYGFLESCPSPDPLLKSVRCV